MCGIIAYKGPRNANKVVINGLKSLEYRGYDSWGIASVTNSGIKVVKRVGRISSFNDLHSLGKSNLAIGHTRWATHGRISERNAHPHFSSDSRLAVVHNGIVENFQELKSKLLKKGHKFKSETDTEIICHIISDFLENESLEVSVRKTFLRLEGRNAIVVLDTKTKEIVAIRDGSPLIIGKGKKEFFVASDIPAFLEYTNNVVFLNDREMVSIGKTSKIYNVDTGEQIKRPTEKIDWDIKQAEKGEYPYFMLKEILEQGHALQRAVNQDRDYVRKIAKEIKNAKNILIIGCGTAGKVAHTGQYLFAKIANLGSSTTFGSEYYHYKSLIDKKTILIVISQSGETADTLEVIKYAKERGAKIMSLVNVMGSTIMRLSDYPILINAGPEKAVASTKATTNQIALLAVLAYACAENLEKGLDLISNTSKAINKMLNKAFLEKIEGLAKQLKDKEDMYVLGRGASYPVALECAIKIQEVSYIHAEGIAAGELKHYAIALVEEGTPVFVLAPNDETNKDIISNAIEVSSRGGYIIGVSPQFNDVFDHHIKIPDLGEVSPIACLISMQLLAYYLAILRGYDPDYPRNLAKSVTVK